MKKSTFVGIFLGALAIFGAFIWEGGSLNSLIMLPAMLIVFGGTLAAGLAGTSFSHFSKLPLLIKTAINPKKNSPDDIINQIIHLSQVARKEGILAVEPLLANSMHPFLTKLFMVGIDGANPDTLLKVADTEVQYVTERHNANIHLFSKLGGYSPTMGIIGTVMGLIATLAAAGDNPIVLIQHISSAFIATLWGIFMANIVWLPIADKLSYLHAEEMQIFQLIIDGVHGVQLGESPTVIRSKLVSIFPLPKQFEILSHPTYSNYESGNNTQTAVINDESQEIYVEIN